MYDVGAIAGDYEGVGQWYDSAGRSGTYQVTQANRVLSDGLEVSFHHDFDDGTVTEARLRLSNFAPKIYRVAIAGPQWATDHGLMRRCTITSKWVGSSSRPATDRMETTCRCPVQAPRTRKETTSCGSNASGG